MVAKIDKKPTSRPVAKEDLEDYVNRELLPLLSKLQDRLNSLLGRYLEGEGSPEGVVTADKGAVYQRQDGVVGSLIYVKTTDGTNTGWVAAI